VLYTFFFFSEKLTHLFQQNIFINRSARRNNVYFCFGKNTSAVW